MGKPRNRPALIVCAFLPLVACAGTLPTGMQVGPNEITRVHIEAIPEGPTAPAFSRSPGQGDHLLSEILPYIPRSLPAPIPQTCGIGGNLTISLADGTNIVYGPCKKPLAIERLWWHYLDILTHGECRPDCWAGKWRGPPGEPMPPDAD